MRSSSDSAKLWLSVVHALKADPSTRVSCPFCGFGVIEFSDYPEDSDLGPIERAYRCPRCHVSAEALLRLP